MITLSNNGLEIQISPEKGASLFSLTYQGINILRPTSQFPTSPQQYSMFLMIPYCSYIQDGHFNYFGISRHVPANQPNSDTPIHGDGWLADWLVENKTSTSATLIYEHHKSEGFPFDYVAHVSYTLTSNQLDITLSITNPSEMPIPCGMGVHPYFNLPQEAIISFKSTHIWFHQNDPIFDRPYPTPPEWDFSTGKPLTENFNTAFSGWDGHASISYPKDQLQIDIQADDIFHHLILYKPAKADYFCLEPVSNTPNAFNLAAYGVIGTGIQSIGAGQTLSKTIHFNFLKA